MANERLRVHADLLRDVGTNKQSARLEEFFTLVKAELPKERPDGRFLRVFHDRLIRFNDEPCLRFLLETAQDAQLPERARQWAAYTLAVLRTNWADDILREWRQTGAAKSILRPRRPAAKDPGTLAADFAKKVAGLPPFEFDLTKRLSNDEVRRCLDATRATSVYREIQDLIEREVREARPTVLKLLDTSKNPHSRKYALEYLGKLFLEESFDVFVSFLEDELHYVRSEAAHWLAKTGSEEAVSILAGRLKREDLHPNEQRKIIEGLGETGSRKAVEALVECSKRFQSEGERGYNAGAIIQILGRFNQPVVVGHLIDIADSDSPGRFAAAWTLAGMDNDKTRRFLQSRIESEDRKVRLMATVSKALDGDEAAIREVIAVLEEKPRWLYDGERNDLIELLARMKGQAIPALLDVLGDQRRGRYVSRKVIGECRKTLESRVDDVAAEVGEYIRRLPEERWFTPSWAIAIEVYCGATEIEKDLLPALRKMYGSFEKQRVDTINRYGKVREALSLKLEEIDGKPYPYTYLDVSGAR